MEKKIEICKESKLNIQRFDGEDKTVRNTCCKIHKVREFWPRSVTEKDENLTVVESVVFVSKMATDGKIGVTIIVEIPYISDLSAASVVCS